MIDTASIDSAGVRGMPAIDKPDIIIGSQKRSGSVLVASGDQYIGKQLAIILERMGYDVVVSGNGEEALTQFSPNPPLKCNPSHSHACGIISHQPEILPLD